MKMNVYANLNQGVDSFLRVEMTLRRKELEVDFLRMSSENCGIHLIINDETASLECVINI